MQIINQIKRDLIFKDMRLDKFIGNALYNRNGYYYKQNPIGDKNDFITAPEISQMFGEIIGLYLYFIWKTKLNSEFNLIELGPGKGTLFKDIAKSVINYPNFLNKAKIEFIEINKNLIKIQKDNLKKLNLKNIRWLKKINYKSNNPLIIYSNEFFDCFPVRQFVLDDFWSEKYVSYNKIEQKFYFKNKIVKNKKLLLSLNKYKRQKIFEISNERNNYFEKICKFIRKNGGIFLTIDYGYFKNLKHFSLQAVQNHKYSNILENIGQKDISSHVNFNEFKNIAIDNKLKIEEYCTQKDFLIKHGILERAKILSKLNNIENIKIDLNRLTNKVEMGELFKCIIVSNL